MSAPRDASTRRLAAEYAAAQAIASSRDPQEAAPRVLEGICQALDLRGGAYWEMDGEGGRLRCSVFWHSPALPSTALEEATCRAELPPGVDLPGRVFQTRRPSWIEDAASDAGFGRARAAAADGLHGAFAVPVVLGDEVRGVLEFFSARVEQADARLLSSIANAGVSLGLLLERTRALQALENSRGWMRLILDSTAEAVYAVDVAGVCTLVNPACLRLLGYATEDELVGKQLHDLIHPAGAAGRIHGAGECPLYEALRTGKGTHSEAEMLWRKDGSCFPAEYWSLPMIEGGIPVGAVVTFFDVGERRESERKVKEAVSLKSDFVSMVAHELRSPLTAVKMALDLVTEEAGGTLGAVHGRLLDTAKRSIDRLVRLVNDVLDYQKLDIGKLDFVFQPEDLGRIARETVEGFTPMAVKKGLTLEARVPDEPCVVPIDADRITQVITNLLSNAVKFTDKGTVSVAVARDGAFARVSVADQGMGIKREDIPKLFKTFTQLPTGRRAGGTGLGLALAKRIVEEHGGRIWIESEPGQGAVFSFTLPAGR